MSAAGAPLQRPVPAQAEVRRLLRKLTANRCSRCASRPRLSTARIAAAERLSLIESSSALGHTLRRLMHETCRGLRSARPGRRVCVPMGDASSGRTPLTLSMVLHNFIGVGDSSRALSFYAVLAGQPALQLRFVHRLCPWAQPYVPGGGPKIAWRAASPAEVDALDRLAIANGARCEGTPGQRSHHHADSCGAYFRGTEGNKRCVSCREAPAARGFSQSCG
jgi:hypothetical protein